MSYTFFHNLSKDTFRGGSSGFLTPRGYLIAPGNAKGQLKALTDQVAQSRRELVLDNGNFSAIGKIRGEFKDEAARLGAKVKTVETALGRSARRGDLPANLVGEFDDLDRRVRGRAKDLVLDDQTMIESQLSLDPDRVIGAEDITMASWLSLDIEHRFTSRRRRDYRRFNKAVAKRARTTLDSLDPELVAFYYPVASAVSYNTAFDAGREFAAAGIDAISMGFGAYMADANFVDHVMIGRRRIDFGGKLPFRYVRTLAVTNGFWNGYQHVAGRPPARFHFLGLGALIMIPPVILAASATPELTFDATSPIKDATKGGTLYIDKPALLKIRTRKVAHRLARDTTHTWSCPCPFCTDFTGRHPFDYPTGHQWFAANQPEKVTATDLRPGGALFDAYPFLSEPKSGQLRKEINFARIGHNHWILERTMTSLERAQQRDGLQTRVTNLINDYQQRTTPPFANALQLALDLADGTLK